MNKYLIKVHFPDGKYTLIERIAESKEEAIKQAKPVKIEVAMVVLDQAEKKAD